LRFGLSVQKIDYEHDYEHEHEMGVRFEVRN